MRIAVTGLRTQSKLPGPVVEAESGAALPLCIAQEAAEVHRAADAPEDHQLLGREQDCLHIDFGTFDAVLPIVDRAERRIDRMLAMQTHPTREIALDYVRIAIRHVVAARDVEMRAR